jgi:hypothetical protein
VTDAGGALSPATEEEVDDFMADLRSQFAPPGT